MKRNKLVVLAAGLVIAGIIGISVYYNAAKKPEVSQIVLEEKISLPEKIVKAEVAPKVKVVAPEVKEVLGPPEEIVYPAFSELKEIAQFKAEPEELILSVSEGGMSSGELTVTNTGDVDVYLNIYRSDVDSSRDSTSERIEEIISYRQGLERETVDPAIPAAGWGVPWLMPYPDYIVLKPNESRNIEITANTRDLKAGAYRVDMILMGAQDEAEVLIVPAVIEVRGAPRIVFLRSELEDGMSAQTHGNANNVADAGEKVLLNVFLKNSGSASAEGLKTAFNKRSGVFEVLSEDLSEISDRIEPETEFKISYLIEVPAGETPKMPPSAYLSVTDKGGTEKKFDLYLGDQDQIAHPLGFLPEKDFMAGSGEGPLGGFEGEE